MGLNAYRFSVEWARVEPEEGTFSAEALDHYEAIVDRCLEVGMAPVVTFNHFTSPHWFAMRGSWLDPKAPELFARYCDRGHGALRRPDRGRGHDERAQPDPPAQLDRPAVLHPRRRARHPRGGHRGDRASRAYRLANVMLPEEMDAFADGMSAGHVAAKAAIKARRPDLPVGLSLAIVDDVVAGDDPSVRDRKRAEVYERWLELARDDDFVGVQNYERIAYDGSGPVAPPAGAALNQMGSAIEPLSLAGSVRYAHEATGVPVLVTEHGMSTGDDSLRADFIEPSLVGLLDVMDEGVPVLGYLHWTLMDNFEWVFGYGHQLGLHEVDRDDLRAHAEAQRRGVRLVRPASRPLTVSPTPPSR